MEYLAFINLFTGFFILCVHAKPQSTNRLTDLIKHYEPVHYDKDAFHRNHHKTKRSAQDTLYLDIFAFGQNFPLRMKRDIDSIAHDVQIETGDGIVQINPDFAYKGYVEGYPHSRVFGVVTSEGIFEGTIRTQTTIYRIEGSSRYELGVTPGQFHSIIYRDKDIEYHKIRTPSACESDNLHRKYKQKFVNGKLNNPNYKNDVPKQPDNSTHSSDKLEFISVNNDNDEGKSKYFQNHKRTKRAVNPAKTQCTLYIQIGHKYYEYWKTEEAVTTQITQHVQAVNDIYTLVDFSGNGSPEGINFIVKRVKIWKSSTETGYKFAGNYDVESFLTRFSDDSDFDPYCLAYIYTYRDYDGGTLGLAWTGSTSSAGGVCERMGTFSGVQKALNAGLISILNYGQVQPQLISFVTFAHEIGHNFGSPHDSEGDATCVPGGTVGNYIMYPKATDGNKPNNNKFSPCSISNMYPVISAKGMDDTNGCFQIPVSTICGNGIVESGEECDCGYDSDCTDTCCNPQVTSGSGSGIPCTLKATSECSPSQGTCCGTDCKFITSNQNVTCRESTGCTAAATCNGVNSTCPDSTIAVDGTKCSASKVCLSGSCSGSLCLIYNMIECQCSPATADDFNDEILCQLCCEENTTSSTCQSSYALSNMPDTQVDAGTVCMNFLGYCDVFSKCRPVIPDGTLSKILSIGGMKAWLQKNWYFPVAGAVGLIILLILMIKFCTPKKKSDKPKKDKKSKVGPSKKGPARREALTPPKAKPYKVYDNPQGYPPAPYGGQMPPGGMPYGQYPPVPPPGAYGANPYGAVPYG